MSEASKSDVQISEAFAVLADLWRATGDRPANKHDNCWEYAWGPWHIALNGHDEKRPSSRGGDVLPFHAMVMHEGWPVLLLWPSGGMTIGGWSAEDDFISAVQAEAARLRP